jgi:murein DD-endopeptidase MepM/ murein hydrolase activator NlpD
LLGWERVGAALVGVVISAVLVSGTPANANPTRTPSPSATGPTVHSGGTQSGGTQSGSTPSGGTGTSTADPTSTDPPPGPASAAVDAHDTAALIAATQALVQAQADLVTATADLDTARAALAAARNADASAQIDLQTTAVAEQRATRDLAAVRSRITGHEAGLGRLASATYRSSGALGEWSLVLGSDTPNQLADRLATLQSVASASNAMIAELNQDRADLTNSAAHLTATREALEMARETARQTLLATLATEVQAAAAEQRLALDVTARQTALTVAQVAASADNVRYGTMLGESDQLAVRIVGLAAQLATGPNPPHGTGHLDRPGRGVVTSPYGMRMHPILHYVKLHTGIDFAVADGISYAADDGVVLITEFNVAYGNMTVIDHGMVGGVRMTTLYAHQAAFDVKPGDHVVKGQPIGLIGATGYATGPHLHFEVRINGGVVDPAPFIKNAPLPPQPKRPRGVRPAP